MTKSIIRIECRAFVRAASCLDMFRFEVLRGQSALPDVLG